MSVRNSLQPAKPWVEILSSAEDWDLVSPEILETMLAQGHLIRAFEEILLNFASEGLVHGPVYSSIGQEGGAVASAILLNSKDGVNGSHRGHHQ